MLHEPIPPQERLRTLDVLRGAALLGILLMNILVFGLPADAYNNPRVWGGNDAINLWTLAIHWVLFEGKMRALFSIMFGAGIVIFMERALARENSVTAADLYVRRMLWLMAFGAAHGWLIWHGDILYSLRPVRAADLPAAQCVAEGALRDGGAGPAADAGLLHRAGVRAPIDAQRRGGGACRAGAGGALTQEQRDAIRDWDRIYNAALPPPRGGAERDRRLPRGIRQDVSAAREGSSRLELPAAYFPAFIDMWAMMLIGMGLFRLGVLQGARPMGFYARVALIGYGIGVPLNALSVYGMISSNFEPLGTGSGTPHITPAALPWRWRMRP